MKLFYFGHHKAGSTWINKIFREVTNKLFIKNVLCHSPKQFDYNIKTFLEDYEDLAFIYLNADKRYIEDLDDYLGFHVIRDPRDIAVSAYFSHLNTHTVKCWPELIEHREKLKKLNLEEGLLCDIEFTSELMTDGDKLKPFDSIFNWDYKNEKILEVKFEELILDPEKVFFRIFSFLNLLEISNVGMFNEINYFIKILSTKYLNFSPKNCNIKLNPYLLSKIIKKNDFEKISGRKRGEEDRMNHYRKGVSGDWKNYFTDVHKNYFKIHYGESLIKIGYETGLNW